MFRRNFDKLKTNSALKAVKKMSFFRPPRVKLQE